jgi:hypothetical protein
VKKTDHWQTELSGLANLFFFQSEISPIHPAVFCLPFLSGWRPRRKNISPISKSLKVRLGRFHFSSVAMGFVVFFFFWKAIEHPLSTPPFFPKRQRKNLADYKVV